MSRRIGLRSTTWRQVIPLTSHINRGRDLVELPVDVHSVLRMHVKPYTNYAVAAGVKIPFPAGLESYHVQMARKTGRAPSHVLDTVTSFVQAIKQAHLA